MKTKVLAALLLCSGAVFAQSNAEDVPPPQPLPPGDAAYEQATPKVAPSRSVPGEEQHAWDFGVSFAPQADGLLVRGVIVGSPAAAMGVKPNDLIVSANSDVADSDALMNTTVSSVTVIRGDQRLELNGSRRSQAPDQSSVLRKPYSAPQTTYAPQQAYSAPRQSYTTPRPSYTVPRTTYSAPRTYYPQRTVTSYRSTAPLSSYRYGYPSTSLYRYSTGPRVSIGLGVGSPGFGYGPGFGRGFGYGPGFYGRPGYGSGFYGRGFGPVPGRSGVGIRIGGFGISF